MPVARGVHSPVLAVLAGTAAAGSVGLVAGGTAGALLGTELAGTTAAAGLPLGLLVLGSAISAMVIAHQSSRGGRASGLALGYLLGMAGAVMCVIAAVVGSLPVFLVGSTLLGSANAAVFLTRYAAADVGGVAAGGRALGSPSSRRPPARFSARCYSRRPAISPSPPGCRGCLGSTS